MDMGELEAQTFSAVRAYARALNTRLANKIIHVLRRAKAVGVYGDDWGHQSLWDEFCHEWQHGPHGALRTAWAQDIHLYLKRRAESVTGEEQLLLTAAAIWQFEEESGRDELCICAELVERGIMGALVDAAMARDLSRFDPQ